MQVKFLSFNVRNPFVVLFIVLLTFVMGMVFYFPNYAKLKRLRAERMRLLSENKKLEAQIRDLQEKNKRLSKDSSLLEKIAREDLGIAKQDEIVIDIEE